jgi:hypothetical protein
MVTPMTTPRTRLVNLFGSFLITLLASASPAPAQDTTPPAVVITTPTDGATLASLVTVSGWATDDSGTVSTVTFALHELDPSGGLGRYWNGSAWQGAVFQLTATRTGTNWAKAAGVTLPALNSGVSYAITASATDTNANVGTATITVTRTMDTLTWDPGTAHAGTAVKTQPHALGGPFIFKIVTDNTSVGGWRSALNVTAGEANLYLRRSAPPTTASFDSASTRAGSDGWVLHSSQFNASEEWYYLVTATAGATWNLVSGEPYVLDLGDLPGPASAGTTAVTMGAEGWRFFRTTPPAGTLAWQLWLNGAANTILLKKNFIPLTSNYEQQQSRAMLVVPDYLEAEVTTFVGVPGDPGLAFSFTSKQQPVTDVAFSSTQVGVVITGFPYATYRVAAPIDQIAWEVRSTAVAGDPNVAARRGKVPNEWDNDAFSEVPGAVEDSFTLVPPWLSDGTFYITVYSGAAHTFTLFNGEPTVTPRVFIGTTTNNAPARVGWRYYVLTNIAEQIGFLGWELDLSNHVAGTEIALRRNAVPGRWNYRSGGYVNYNAGAVDYSGTDGFLQRPGHQADIWYIGIYQPAASLGAFRLTTRAIPAPIVAFNTSATDVAGLANARWTYFRIDVPADVEGWYLRLTNVTAGLPQLAVRRDLLPISLDGWNFGHDWPSGTQASPGVDYTSLYYRADGASEYGQIFVVGRSNAIVAGTYYIGVRSDSGASSFRLSSRGIGASYAIGVSNLNFSGVGSKATNSIGLPGREADFYRLVVPSNSPNWLVRLTPTAGEALLAVQRDYLPNVEVGAGGNDHWGYGKRLQKIGREHFLFLPWEPNATLDAETNFLAVVSEGVGPDYPNSRLGTGSTSYILESLGSLAVNTLGAGALPPAGGGPLTHHVTLEGGQITLWKFTVPAGVEAMEVRLLNRVGNPAFTLRPGTNAAYPHAPIGGGDNYGADGGWFSDRREGFSMLTWANPTNGTWTLTMKAEDEAGEFPDAECDVEIVALASTSFAFNVGVTNVTGHATNTWRYYRVTVPVGALGWDLRLTNVTAGVPRLVVRKDLRPDSVGTTVPYWNEWPAAGQVAPWNDWTSRAYNEDSSENTSRLAVFGMGNPLTNGTYYVGVFNDSSLDTEYTLVSRGIGTGYAIGVMDLPFASGTHVNATGLPAREAAYYRLVVPSNAPNWRLRLEPDGDSEALLVVQAAFLPPSEPLAYWPGQKMQKAGKEFYTRLAPEGSPALQPGTNYVAVVSEGVAPADDSHTGAGNATYTLQSLVLPVTDLGVLPLTGPPILQPIAVEGGEVKLFRFRLTNAIPSVEVLLSNRVNNPVFSLIPGTNAPVPQLPWFYPYYGVTGGHTPGIQQSDSLVTLANVAPDTYSLTVMGMGWVGGFPTSEADLWLILRGPTPLDYANGVESVSDQAPQTWRFFQVTVPGDSVGWELRVTGVSGGDPHLAIRREALPETGVPNFSMHGATWPSGGQLDAGSDWTGLNESDGSFSQGRYFSAGRGNPLEPGVYFVGVRNASGSDATSYTISSRGIGGAGGIPITPLTFAGGSLTSAPLAARQLAYYRVEVPSNAPSWRLRLDTSAGGDALLVVHKGRVPNVENALIPYPANGVGKGLAKAGNEHYVLLPDEGLTNIAGGTYYLAVVSDGVNPDYGAGRIGTGDSMFTLESSTPVNVTSLGLVPAPGSMISSNVTLEGGETKAFRFRVAGGVDWVELRLANRTGNPALASRPGLEVPHPSVPIFYYNPYGADGGWTSGRREDFAFLTLIRPDPTNTFTVKAEYSGGLYPDAAATIEIEQKLPSTLAYSNGVVSGTLANNQRTFYRVTVPPGQIGWRLELTATNGTPTLRARKDLLPADDEPAMGFGGPTVILSTPFLTAGTWYVEVKGGGVTSFTLTSNPVLLQRPAWAMQAFSAPVTTPGLPPAGPLFADTGVETNGVPLPGDQGTDLGEGDFHFYAFTVPDGNVGLLRVESLAISGNPDVFIRRGGVPTFDHYEYGYYGAALVDYQLVGTGTEYGNFVPLDGRTETQLGNGIWFVSVRANASNVRYRLQLGTGAITPLSGSTLGGQVLAGNDWRYYRIAVLSNAPLSFTVTYSQQQGDVEMYVRDTVPPGEPLDGGAYRRWARDNKNGGPYPDFPDPGTFTLTTPALRPNTPLYLGFRAAGGDASFTVGLTVNPQNIDVTNVVAFYGGLKTVTIPAGGVAKFRVPVPADATSWRHYCTNAASVLVYLDQGTLPDLGRPWWIWESGGVANAALIQFLYGWPWVANQHYFLIASNTSAMAQSFTLRMDGRNAATDDTDGDGLPDGWEIFYFGNLNQDGSGDPDGDGVNNATELAEGTNPANGSSYRPRLTVTTVGAGSVVIDPNLPSYALGQPVLLTAVPDAGQFFNLWSGDGSGVVNPLSITMSGHKSITANFSGAATPLVFTNLALNGSGHFTAQVTGPSGASLVVLGSPDLSTWTPIVTNTPFTGTFDFTDPAPATLIQRSYRAELTP